ncbi:MAG: hypothetical protein AB1568_11325 [Thermodesulfobacteriota bacterium]
MSENPPPGKDQRGSVLVAVIVGMVVVGALGAAMMSFYTSSTAIQAGSADFTTAYYIAEGGARYATDKIVAFEYNNPSKSDAGRTSLIASLNNQTFTLADGTRFTLALSYAAPVYTLESTGILHSTISRKITYHIDVYQPPGGSEGVPVPFNTSPSDSGVLNPDDWNTAGNYSISSGRLNVSTSSSVMISTDWYNASSSLPNLLEIWLHSDNLLTYEVQAKISTGTDDLVAGISFRLNTQKDANISNDTFYGLSLLDKENGSSLPAFVNRAGGAVSLSNNTQHIILWKQVSGTKTILERITAPAAILNSGNFENYTGLVVRLQEQYDVSGNRVNLIRAYYSDKDVYPSGTLNWNYANFTQIAWTGCDAAVDCSPTVGQCTCIVDTTLTSANFDTIQPDEIGLHTFGGDSNSKANFSDLSLRFNFDGGFPTVY